MCSPVIHNFGRPSIDLNIRRIKAKMPSQKLVEPLTNTPTVAIIGAGISGLSAAHYLMEHGIETIAIYEARDRIGGRMHTVMHEGKPLEMGAQFIHGGCVGNSVFNLAVRYNLTLDPLEFYDDMNIVSYPGHLYRSDGRILPDDVIKAAVSIYGDILKGASMCYREKFEEDGSPETSLSDFYEQVSMKAIEKLKTTKSDIFVDDVSCALNAYKQLMASYVGDALDQASLSLYGTYTDVPGGNFLVPQGLKSICAELAEPLLIKKKIHMTSVVQSVDYSGENEVTVEYYCGKTKQQRTTKVDYVISTLPLGVIKRRHEEMFIPGLPEDKLIALNHMGEGLIAKIYLKFDTPWWKPIPFGITLAWSDKEMEDMVLPREWYKGVSSLNDVDDSQPNLLVCFISGECAKVADELHDTDVLRTLGMLIRQFSGDPTIPMPTEILRTKWTREEYSFGTYSAPKIGMREAELETLIRPVPSEEDPKVFFAGEAFHLNYYSNMNGARLSGLREADRIVRLGAGRQQ